MITVKWGKQHKVGMGNDKRGEYKTKNEKGQYEREAVESSHLVPEKVSDIVIAILDHCRPA